MLRSISHLALPLSELWLVKREQRGTLGAVPSSMTSWGWAFSAGVIIYARKAEAGVSGWARESCELRIP